MAAPTVRQIRAGMGSRLSTISGLHVHDTVVGQISPPAAIVGMPSRPEVETFGLGTNRWDLTVWVVVARQADASSEKAVEAYLDPVGSTSVRAAVYGDKTLGGVVDDTYELSAEPVDLTFGGPATGDRQVTYLGLEFAFMILADGSS